jgi:hypothetical protein
VIQVYAARAVGGTGLLGVHTRIALKPTGAGAGPEPRPREEQEEPPRPGHHPGRRGEECGELPPRHRLGLLPRLRTPQLQGPAQPEGRVVHEHAIFYGRAEHGAEHRQGQLHRTRGLHGELAHEQSLDLRPVEGGELDMPERGFDVQREEPPVGLHGAGARPQLLHEALLDIGRQRRARVGRRPAGRLLRSTSLSLTWTWARVLRMPSGAAPAHPASPLRDCLVASEYTP